MTPLTIILTTLSLLFDTHHVPCPHRRKLGVTRTQQHVLHELFHSQSQQLTQLQMANSTLEDHALEAQSDVPICWLLLGATHLETLGQQSWRV